MPTIETWDKIKSVNIDMPFSQNNDFRLDGSKATSFKTLKEQIDRASTLGFNAIGFDTNVPINIKNGELQLFITKNDNPSFAEGNRDKSFPEDVWKAIEYAESLGLKTSIDLHIRNALNDEAINLSNITSTFQIDTFFNSVRVFETEIAKKSQIYGVDSIRIGSFNSSFDTQEYKNNWVNLIDSIRNVYKGSLSYQSNVENKNSVIWNLVDIIKVNFTPKWLLESSFTSEEIAQLYLKPYIAGNQKLSSESAYDSILSLIKKFPDKKIELQVRFDPGQSAGHEFADPWSYVFAADPLKENAKDPANIVPYPENWIDTNLTNQKIAGFFEFFGNYLDKDISAIQFWQYMPWTEANWLRDPKNLHDKAWQSVVRALGALNWNQEAEKMISTYLTNEWGFSKLHFGSVSDDLLSGSSVADKFFGSGGIDKMDGGAGIDTVVYAGNRSNYAVTKGASSYTVTDKTGTDGTDTLQNIEVLKFSDKTVNLTVQAKAASAPPADVTRLVELYTAFFNRVPDADGMSYWIDAMKSGQSINQVAESFYNAGVNYSSLTGFSSTMTNADFINVIYKNVLGRKDGADADGLLYWQTEITLGRETSGTLVNKILDSAHTFKGNATWGWVADLLDNKITVAKKFSIDMGLNYNTPEESITIGMAIASAITATDTSAAVNLIGVAEANFLLS